MAARKHGRAPIIVETKSTRRRVGGRSVTYQRELVLCGKGNCSKRHGPYWYAYWWESRGLFERGAVRKRYIGRQWRELSIAEALRVERASTRKRAALGKARSSRRRGLPKAGSAAGLARSRR